jgi:type I restriction enzyme M protein
MFKHVSEVVFPFIKNLRNGSDVLYSEYMKDATFIIPKASLLQEAVSIIDDIKVVGEKPDIQGDIYEHLLGELKTAGKNGQFRTPRHIIRMMVELVDPDIGQKICDPACGSGGFLIVALEHVWTKLREQAKRKGWTEKQLFKREVEFRKELPISSAGKILRRVLQEEEKKKTIVRRNV